jgi:hypothetical protein
MTVSKKLACIVLVCCFLRTFSAAAQNTPAITYDLKAKDFDNSNSARLLVTAEVPETFGKLEIQFVPPPGFVVDPTSLSFDPRPGKRIVAARVRRMSERRGTSLLSQ